MPSQGTVMDGSLKDVFMSLCGLFALHTLKEMGRGRLRLQAKKEQEYFRGSLQHRYESGGR